MAKGGLLLAVALLGLQRTPANAFLHMRASMAGAVSASRGWVGASGEGGMRRIGMLRPRVARRSVGPGGSFMMTGEGRSSAEVILVGSGVGGVEYLTVGAREALERADAVVYDALADEKLLALAPQSCTRHFVGKRGGDSTSTPQAEIERLLVSLAQEMGAGKKVVRLKAGDPFVFGRARGEVETLAKAAVAFRVVPGLSSAITGPLLAGVPLTDPLLSRSFAVLSGFDLHGKAPHDLQGFSAVDTLVVLMGGSRLAGLCWSLVEAGRVPSTPVLVIRWAGHPDKQEEWRGTLETIAAVTEGHSLSPAVIVVGQAAALHLRHAPPPNARLWGDIAQPPGTESVAEGSGTDSVPPSEAYRGTDPGAVAPPAETGGAKAALEGGTELTRDFDHFLLDMDGVLWGGGHAIPGAQEAVVRLREMGKSILFITNNSAKSRRQVVASLAEKGFEAAEHEVVTSAFAAAILLQTAYPEVRKAFVIGQAGLIDELFLAGIEAVTFRGPLDEPAFAQLQLDPQVGAVVSGWDTGFSWASLAVASAYVQRGAVLIGTNPDAANRVGDLLMPENGAQLAALEAASGGKAIIAGKPSLLLVDLVAQRCGIQDPTRAIMVGDRLDTDVAFGNSAGYATALVLTGVANRAALAAASPDAAPDFVLDSLLSAVTGLGLERHVPVTASAVPRD